MPVKVHVPARGFVLTSDQREIDALINEGGRVVTKNREIEQTIEDLIGQDAAPAPVVDTVEEVKPVVIKRKRV